MVLSIQALFSAIVVILTFLLMRFAKSTAKCRIRQPAGATDHGLVSPVEHFEQIGEAPKSRAEDGHRQNILEEMEFHKALYFKLQNLEQHPEVLPQARGLLISLLSEALQDTSENSKYGILSIEHYSLDAMANFLWAEHRKTTQKWIEYLERRRLGQPREMFQNEREAKWWLEQVAPLKYVDGAWLGHIHKTTTPFPSRQATKHAWQILSEELGDGDLNKNHVHIYRKLMRDIRSELPDGDTIDFIHPRHRLNQPRIWKAAVAHLLVSLFPHEFLAEILGFNLHFEQLTLDTLECAKELGELKIDPSYFHLHICIDNADSGHTAMAKQAVIQFLKDTRRLYGDDLAHQAWRRVQAGFILSQSLSTNFGQRLPLVNTAAGDRPRNKHEAKLIQIFRNKAPAAHNIHSSTHIKIGRRKLNEWLDPDAFASTQWQMDFVDDLGKAVPWVRAGDSSGSKLVQELSWQGKMFGAFTHSEAQMIKRWIDSLGAPKSSTSRYWSFTQRDEMTSGEIFRNQDNSVNYPVFLPITVDNFAATPIASSASAIAPLDFRLAVEETSSLCISSFLPLWFTHSCLLESFISVPFKTITKRGSLVIQVLRAQQGFDIEGPIVAGMDEVCRSNTVGIVELGQEIMKSHGLKEPESLKEVLREWHDDFALAMLDLSVRPIANEGLLLGLARAFVDLHDITAASRLLSAPSRAILRQIACREQEVLDICAQDLKVDEVQYTEFVRGYRLGRAEIERCFVTK